MSGRSSGLTPAGARTTRRRLLTPMRVIIGGAVLGGGALLYLAVPGTVATPTYQVPLEMPGMQPHLLNMWVTPDPMTVGDAELTAQVVDRGGNPVIAGSITFKLLDSAGDMVLEAGGSTVPRTNRADAGRFRAVVRVPAPAQWWLELSVEMAGRSATARFPVDVE